MGPLENTDPLIPLTKIIAVDDLAMQGARESSVMLLTSVML